MPAATRIGSTSTRLLSAACSSMPGPSSASRFGYLASSCRTSETVPSRIAVIVRWIGVAMGLHAPPTLQRHYHRLTSEFYSPGLRTAPYRFDGEEADTTRPPLHPPVRFQSQPPGRVVPAET